jgi:hypothetical protein
MADERKKDSENIAAGQIPSSDLLDSSSPHPLPLSQRARGDAQTASFGKLAKRITGITSNCLFTAIVLVAGLGVGRQILIWWSADAPRQAAPSPTGDLAGGLGDPTQLHLLQFGGQGWSMARREFHGPRKEAEKQLRRDCRQEIGNASLPQGSQTLEQSNLLASLAKSQAIDAELPHWQLFAPDPNTPVLIGVKPPLQANEKQTKTEPDANASRVVLWGISLPKGGEDWSILIFIPSAGVEKSPHELPDVPLPPKCRKILAVQAVNGGKIATFSGPNEPEAWRGHFEKWFAPEGWKPISPWQRTGSAWYTQYRGNSGGKIVEVDLHFAPDNRGELTGMMIFRVRE